MGRVSLEVRVIAFAFLWLCVSESGWATRKEDLERAAELAVERAAERAAERAVEKALESGNSTSETETIRESYSSVRKSDKTLQLPGSGYSPAQRHEYDRIMREREAAERASALVKRSMDNGGAYARQLVIADSDHRSQQQKEDYKKAPEIATPTSKPRSVTKQLPFPVGGHESSNVTDTRGEQQQHQRLPPAEVDGVRDQFPSVYPVKVLAIKTTKPYPFQLFHVLPPPSPIAVATSTSAVTYPHSIDRQTTWVANTADYSVVNENRRRPGQGWIYR